MKATLIKLIKQSLCLMMTLLFLSGCVSSHTPDDLSRDTSELSLTEVSAAKLSDTLSQQDVRDDIQLLVYALKHGYSGKLRIPPAHFNHAIQALNNLAEQQRPFTRESLLAEIDSILKQLPDNHLRISYAATYIKRLKQTYTTPDQPPYDNKPPFWSSENITIDSKTVLYIKIKTFAFRADPRWQDLLAYMKHSLAKSSAIIFDLRDNGGGDSTQGDAMLSLLLGSERHNNALISKTFYSTPQAAHLYCSHFGPLYRSDPSYCKKVLQAANSGDERFLAQQLMRASIANQPIKQVAKHEWQYNSADSAPEPFSYDPKKGFNGVVYILTNEGCASSCEDFTLAMKATYPYTVTVGQATGGFLHFGEVGLLLLPKTYMAASIPTAVFDYYPSYQDKRGIPPDVYVAKDSDALAATKNMIMHFKHW